MYFKRSHDYFLRSNTNIPALFSSAIVSAPLQIYAPKEFEDYFKLSMELFCKGLGYKVTFHPVDTTETNVIYEDKSLTVETIPLEHRVPCCGFLFCEKPTAPHIRRDMIDFYNIPISQINNVKAGAD